MSKINSNYILISSLLLIVLLFYLFLNNNKNKKELSDLLSYKSADSLSHSIEGLNIWDISSVTNEEFKNALDINCINAEYIFFIAIDSINCIKCFNYHSEHWATIVKEIPGFVYSKSLFKFVKHEFLSANLFELKAKKQIQINSKNINFLFLLLNRNGKILYSDISELKNYKRSEMFYNIINRQIK